MPSLHRALCYLLRPSATMRKAMRCPMQLSTMLRKHPQRSWLVDINVLADVEIPATPNAPSAGREDLYHTLHVHHTFRCHVVTWICWTESKLSTLSSCHLQWKSSTTWRPVWSNALTKAVAKTPAPTPTSSIISARHQPPISTKHCS